MDNVNSKMGVQGPAGDDVSSDDAVAGNRTRSRDSLFLIAKLRLGAEAEQREVRVRNLSEGGLMLELDRLVAVGTAVHLDLRGIGAISGTVAWATAGRVGVALDAPIDPKKARKPVGGARPAVTPFYAKAVPR